MDRNIDEKEHTSKAVLSLSARRAWIEIILDEQTEQESTVALRKESVDRNGLLYYMLLLFLGRSPQGERG